MKRLSFRAGRGLAEGMILTGAVLITLSATCLEDTGWQMPLMYISLGLLLAALAVIFFSCRCPKCGQVVFKNLIGAKRCPDCGGPLWISVNPQRGGKKRDKKKD